MLQKNYVPNSEVKLAAGALEGLSPIQAFLLLLQSVNEEMQMSPQVFRMKDSCQLRVLYSGSVYEADSFLSDYGHLLGRIQKGYPITINGLINGVQDGCIMVSDEDGETVFRKYNTTGKNFRYLNHLCLKLVSDSGESCDFLYALAKNFHRENGFIAIQKKWRTFPDAIPLLTKQDFFFYEYIQMSDAPEQESYFSMVNSLTIPKITRLWIDFLSNGVSYSEFQYLWDALQSNYSINIYHWEIALKLALEELRFTISFVGSDFICKDSEGNRVLFDFARSAAEKVLLKFLFPE